MKYRNNYAHIIPEDMAAEVLAEAARLYTESNKGYSLEDLQQAGLEARIPPDVIKQAVFNVEERHYREQTKQRQLGDFLKKLIYKVIPIGISLLIPITLVSGIPIGISFLIPAALIASIFIFRARIDSVISGLISGSNSEQQRHKNGLQTLTVQVGRLEYFTDQKGLFIAVSDINYDGVEGIIGTDGYKSIAITSCKLGDVYEYQGVEHYRIKMIQVERNSPRSVTFQIEQQEEQPQNQLQQLQQEIQRLQEQSKQFQKQLNEVQTERDLINQQLQQQNQKLQQLEQENSLLKTRNSYVPSTFDINKEPGVILREDFRIAITGKTMQEVIEAVGRPSSSNEFTHGVYWTYDKQVKDPASGKIGSAEVKFIKGFVEEVTFLSY